MVRIVIFGIGKTYEDRRGFFRANRDRITIKAFLDNDSKVQGKELDGVMVYAPEDIENISYDGIVILSTIFGQEMRNQLLGLGIKPELVWSFNTLKLTAIKGKRTLYGRYSSCKQGRDKVLILSTDMEFNGGTMVAVYAAQALQERGHEVMLSAPSIEERLLEEVLQAGLSITVWDCLPYIVEEDREWINSYDIVLVNVFQMMNCAYEISKVKPVLWWIHEDRSIWKSIYQDTKREFSAIDTPEWMGRVNVLGVSSIAQEAFNYFYPKVITRTLPFGIPDRCAENIAEEKRAKLVFAVTAGFSVFKGQSVLIEAIKKLPEREKAAIEIWFIGPEGKNRQELEDICGEVENLKFPGLLSHEEVIGILPQIDVLVCPSLIETMSMSTIEGMMFGKVCITTDMTGIAGYIQDGRNGFVVKANDSDELAERMSWVINNKTQCELIKKEARRTYEREFRMDVFGQRLEAALNECRVSFGKDREKKE